MQTTTEIKITGSNHEAGADDVTVTRTYSEQSSGMRFLRECGYQMATISFPDGRKCAYWIDCYFA